ncbi:PREDICTED: 26S proteasome non-ATPase regulatory subunit 4-like isoform X2 [Priapulus caudatus]|nr:PREDICTED: 26S proteasome non-ATPase regulatory subunit 4-like isoform X2 [Priapulus caudatus]
MRNGDYLPTRLQAQQDAVNLICRSKTRSNPENSVGLMTLANVRVLVTLTSDAGNVMAKLHQIQPSGFINIITGIRIAHLALKHRQGKNHRMRIIVFVGSPIESDEKELVKLAKRLKKEKVNIDIVNFGEEGENTEKLMNIVNTVNGKDGNSSHLVTIPPGSQFSEALISSPVVQGEDGAGAIGMGANDFEFGVDPAQDPELALALRVSMEEQRARQEAEARKVTEESAKEVKDVVMADDASNEEALLAQALAMSMQQDEEAEDNDAEEGSAGSMPDFATMTEEEQIAYAMQMSLQAAAAEAPKGDTKEVKEEPMETESTEPKKEEEDYSDVMNDPTFLQSVLENLPGVDPQSEAIRSAMGSLTGQEEKPKPKGKDPKEKK